MKHFGKMERYQWHLKILFSLSFSLYLKYLSFVRVPFQIWYLTKVSSKICFHKVSSQHSVAVNNYFRKLKSFWATYLHLILTYLMSKNGQIYLDPSSTLWMKGLMLLPQVLQKVPMIRSSHPEVFCKKDVLRTFAKFTGKHLCLSTSGLQLY